MTKIILRHLLISSVLLFSFSCATKPADQRKSDAPVKVVEAPALKSADLTQVSTSANVQAAHDEVEKQLSKLNKNTEDESSDEPTIVLKPAPVAHLKTAPTHAVDGVEPEKALGWLKNGNVRFFKNRLRKDGQSAADVKRLSKGQKPHTIVLGSSDSRVPPEILFDQKLGEIFVVRTAGAALDSSGIESIEYALAHLGTRHVLILGHTRCEAAQVACVDARGAAFELTKKSQIVHSLLEDKKIMISTAVYDIETGKVEFNK